MAPDEDRPRTTPPELNSKARRVALSGPSRYVILHHELPSGLGRPTHWDLMFESAGVLKTWALAEPPELGAIVIGNKLPDHRMDYLDYEGPVSGNRGCVSRWDWGACNPVLDISFRYVSLIGGGRFGTAWVHLEPLENHRWLCRFTPAPSAAT